MTMHKLKLVHMGDSITFGQHIDSRLRWTSLVADHLHCRFAKMGLEIESHNCGMSGETTRLGLERYPEDVQELKPDVLTLQFGLNDCNCWQTDRGMPRVSELAFKANLLEMIERARRFGARQIILPTNHRTLRRMPMVSGEAYEEANARYSEIIKEVARETMVALCDIRKAFMQFSDEKLASLLLPAPDQLHLSIEGNRYYADTILPYIGHAVEIVVQDARKEWFHL
jgi:lysophospholipase L1-like esterase